MTYLFRIWSLILDDSVSWFSLGSSSSRLPIKWPSDFRWDGFDHTSPQIPTPNSKIQNSHLYPQIPKQHSQNGQQKSKPMIRGRPISKLAWTWSLPLRGHRENHTRCIVLPTGCTRKWGLGHSVRQSHAFPHLCNSKEPAHEPTKVRHGFPISTICGLVLWGTSRKGERGAYRRKSQGNSGSAWSFINTGRAFLNRRKVLDRMNWCWGKRGRGSFYREEIWYKIYKWIIIIFSTLSSID